MYISIVLLVSVLSNLTEADSSSNTTTTKSITTTHDPLFQISYCKNKIYCSPSEGNHLLPIVQRAKIYSESKTFVDMVQKNDPMVTLNNFKAMMEETKNNPMRERVREFVENNFSFENELENWIPDDFVESPPFLDKIPDSSLRVFAKILVNHWPLLGRKVSQHVHDYPTRHSLFPLPNGFIIPGGKKREMHYWDSYWIVRGLLISGMKKTVKGILDNFCSLLNDHKLKLIPKGSRVYYTERTAPPLLALMVKLYMEYTNDTESLKKYTKCIEKDLDGWFRPEKHDWKRMQEKTVNRKSYKNIPMWGQDNFPRPEAFIEDESTCKKLTRWNDEANCYKHLRAADENGWDFSTRWIPFDDENSSNKSLEHIDMRRLIKVDLCAVVCQTYKILSKFYLQLSKSYIKVESYKRLAMELETFIQEVLYDPNDGIWYDYDTIKQKPRKRFYASNFAPLWTECYNLKKKEEYGKNAATYFAKQGIESYWGVPSSFNKESSEQWDFPNAFAPMQEIVASGLYNTGNKHAQAIAENIASRWVISVIKAYGITGGGFFDKYDVTLPGKYGGSIKDPPQLGYGYTIGMALAFIERYTSSSRILKAIWNPFSYSIVLSLVLIVSKLLCY